MQEQIGKIHTFLANKKHWFLASYNMKDFDAEFRLQNRVEWEMVRENSSDFRKKMKLRLLIFFHRKKHGEETD